MNHAIRERKEKGNEKEKRKGTRGRERQEEEEEEKEKEEGKEEEKEKEQVAFVKGFSFFSWLQDQLWKKFAANVNTENKPTHGQVPWKFVEKLFFNKGLISGLILLEQGEEQDFFRKKCSEFFTRAFFLTKENAKKNLPQWWTVKTLHGFKIIWKILATIANLATNQDTTLFHMFQLVKLFGVILIWLCSVQYVCEKASQWHLARLLVGGKYIGV